MQQNKNEILNKQQREETLTSDSLMNISTFLSRNSDFSTFEDTQNLNNMTLDELNDHEIIHKLSNNNFNSA